MYLWRHVFVQNSWSQAAQSWDSIIFVFLSHIADKRRTDLGHTVLTSLNLYYSTTVIPSTNGIKYTGMLHYCNCVDSWHLNLKFTAGTEPAQNHSTKKWDTDWDTGCPCPVCDQYCHADSYHSQVGHRYRDTSGTVTRSGSVGITRKKHCCMTWRYK